MNQQRKIRPTRAERARQKTRVPNLPASGEPTVQRSYEPVPPRAPDATPVFGSVPVPVRPAPRAIPGMILDYSYVRTDLVRIAVIFSVLLVLMIGLAFVIR